MARRTRRADDKRNEVLLVSVALLVLVIFLSSIFAPSISGKLSLSDIFPFLKNSKIGGDEIAQPVPSCSNEILDVGETDVDCGGVCDGCDLAQACEQNKDCKSNACDTILRVCTEPSCNDNAWNGDEEGVDCGGSCAPCHCFNGLLDARLGEEKVDCSISNEVCPTCDAKGYPPHCSDRIQSVGELVGIDCGGSCSFMGRKNPQTCYTHEQACESADFWWCGKKAKCLPVPVSDCISTQNECEYHGFFWCDLYSTCYDEKAYWCLNEKVTCEAGEFFWCENFNYCINYKYCNCHSTEEICEADETCDWVFLGGKEQCMLSNWLASQKPLPIKTE